MKVDTLLSALRHTRNFLYEVCMHVYLMLHLVCVFCILFISFPFSLFYEPNTHVLTFLLLNAYLSKIFFDEHINSSGELTRRTFPLSSWASFPSIPFTRYNMEQPRWRNKLCMYYANENWKRQQEKRRGVKWECSKSLKWVKNILTNDEFCESVFNIFLYECLLYVVRVVGLFRI